MTYIYIMAITSFVLAFWGVSFMMKEDKRRAKVDKEDEILHELTACREDVERYDYGYGYRWK